MIGLQVHSSYVIQPQTVSYCFTRYVNETSCHCRCFKTKVRFICDVRQVDNYRGLNADGNDCTINNSSIIPLPICSEAFVKGITIGSTKSKGDETMTTILQLSDLHIGPHTMMKKDQKLTI